MRLISGIFKLFCILIIFAVGCVFYGFKIEPYRIDINKHELNEKQDNMEGIKIVQISDLHIKEDFTHENLAKVVDKINEQSPDVVVFTGDLYDNYAKYNDDEKIIAELKRIEVTYGKIAIWGNHDYGGGAVRQYENIMSQADFTLLKNESLSVATDSDKEIMFTGLDDYMMGDQQIPQVDLSSSLYNILLLHEPDVVKNYMDYDYHAVLSGHSHGGQVDIPFLPILTETVLEIASYATDYSRGLYELENGKKIYVNTGIGTTRISVRFGVVPEISVFNVYI